MLLCALNGKINQPFLAELMKLKFIHRRRLSLNLLHGFLSNFSFCFPWDISPEIFYEYFSFSFTWDPVGAKISKRYSYKSEPKVFKLFLNFLLMVLSKLHLGFLKFWKLKYNNFFLLIRDPMGVKISIHWSYKSQPTFFKLVLNFPPNGPHKTVFGVYEILSLWFLSKFFRNCQIHHCT